MTRTTSTDPAAALPRLLPLFPLTGSLLLPGSLLPLNVFERRYRNLVEDALEAERHIGIIQPLVPAPDNWPALEEPPANPRLYEVGCAGRIESREPQPDGRFHILLKGVSRFRVMAELPLRRGYRQVQAGYEEFAADLDEPRSVLDPARLLLALRAFAEAHSLGFDFDLLGALPGVALLNGLAAALPFGPAEKQALLEAAGPPAREELLLALLSMGMGIEGIEPAAPDGRFRPPTVH
ncbi:MAG TPA: LON peptidase substrate-binding domain-containing protein [Thermoanaerobaculia bacterium]|nr:LON peptidase substrate-binding domain-containing protein [Thermoanaerobaculia bacterium]